MTPDVTPATDHTPVSANGTPPAESAVDRAVRVLRGDIRPDDYLPASVSFAAFAAGAAARGSGKMLPEAVRMLHSDLALQEHHAGDEVLVHHTPDGVVVLAAGPRNIHALVAKLPPELLARARGEHPATFM